jgi:hypothetical protein
MLGAICFFDEWFLLRLSIVFICMTFYIYFFCCSGLVSYKFIKYFMWVLDFIFLCFLKLVVFYPCGYSKVMEGRLWWNVMGLCDFSI